MPPVGFKPTISAGERPQTYTLDCMDSTHIHTNNTENGTKETIHTTQKLGKVWAMPYLCGFYLGICLTSEEKVQ